MPCVKSDFISGNAYCNDANLLTCYDCVNIHRPKPAKNRKINRKKLQAIEAFMKRILMGHDSNEGSLKYVDIYKFTIHYIRFTYNSTQ